MAAGLEPSAVWVSAHLPGPALLENEGDAHRMDDTKNENQFSLRVPSAHAHCGTQVQVEKQPPKSLTPLSAKVQCVLGKWEHCKLSISTVIVRGDGKLPCLLGQLRLVLKHSHKHCRKWVESEFTGDPYTFIRIHPLFTIKEDNGWGPLEHAGSMSNHFRVQESH